MPRSTPRDSSATEGTRRLAIIVPCHRVVRADGGLGGYRWGVDRKRALLDGERGGRQPGPRSRTRR